MQETVGKRRGRPPKKREDTGIQPVGATLLDENTDQNTSVMSEENWLEGFSAFYPRRAPATLERRSFVSISPNSGTISVSSDLGDRLTFHSEDGRGWVSLWRDDVHKRVAIVAEHEQTASTIRISPTKGRRYVINAKAFLITKNVLPKERVTIDAEWKEGPRAGAVFDLPDTP